MLFPSMVLPIGSALRDMPDAGARTVRQESRAPLDRLRRAGVVRRFRVLPDVDSLDVSVALPDRGRRRALYAVLTRAALLID